MKKEGLDKSGVIFLKQRIKEAFASRRILWDMSVSQLKAKYAGLKLGAWWVVIIPLLMASCINFIFVSVFNVSIPNYLFFILSGIFPWFFISQAISESTNAFYANKGIIRQGVFPKEFIPISSVLSNFIHFVMGFCVVLILFFFINVRLVYLLPVLSVILLLNLVFIAGLGMVFAVLNSYLRDTAYFLSVGLMFWFWITPVFYSETMLDFPYRWVCLFNPVTYYISAYRQVLYAGHLPSAGNMIILFLTAFIAFSSGYIFYLKNESEVLKRT
ncbi:MAG: ABC transporter permease [Candidatus Omnitrophica bacterium]|nr:ABC transporter permease [Candidatus Omnitrophota bacterium]MDD5078096.1 ABC transporter permease [Candidatus Omnitrophota bacterium]MDD5725088.1 ABC transporter permease [Candidatus Omnitrophota bacterium]